MAILNESIIRSCFLTPPLPNPCSDPHRKTKNGSHPISIFPPRSVSLTSSNLIFSFSLLSAAFFTRFPMVSDAALIKFHTSHWTNFSPKSGKSTSLGLEEPPIFLSLILGDLALSSKRLETRDQETRVSFSLSLSLSLFLSFLSLFLSLFSFYLSLSLLLLTSSHWFS